MRCKLFTVPLESVPALDREWKVNEFLSSTDVKQVFASIANPTERPVWSVLCFYDEAAQAAQTSKGAQTATAVKVPTPAPPVRTPQATQPTQTIPASHAAPLDSGPPLTGEQVKWIMALKKWRAEQAEQEGVPLYMVAQNKWLEDIVRMPARGLDDLTKVRGLGEWRVQKYGSKILETLNAANAPKRSWPASSHPAGRA